MRFTRGLYQCLPARLRAKLAEPKYQTTRWRWTLRGGVLTVALLVLLLLLPTIISWGPGATVISRIGGWMIPGRVKLGGISCGWFSGFYLKNVEIDDPGGKPVLRLGQFQSSNAALLGLAFGRRDFGNVDVKGLRLTITRDAQGVTNLQQALGLRTPSSTPAKPAAASEPPSIPPSLKATLNIPDATVSVTSPASPPVLVQLKGTAKVEGGKELTSHFEINLTQKEQAGLLLIDAKASNYADKKGQVTAAAAKVDATVDVQSLNLAAVDQLLGQTHFLTVLLGPSLQARIVARGTLDHADGLLSAHSQWLNVDGGITTNGHAIVAKPGSAGHFKLTPAAWARLTGGGAAGSILAPVDFQASLDQLRLPISGGNLPDLASTQVGLILAASDLTIQRPAAPSALTISGLKLGLDTKALGKAVALSAHFNVDHDQRHGRIQLTGAIHDLLDAAGHPHLTALNAQGDLTLSDLDLPGIEQWAGVPADMASTLGPTLGGSGHLTVTPAPTPAGAAWTLGGELRLATDDLKFIGTLAGDADLDGLILKKGSAARMLIDPKLVHRLLIAVSADRTAPPPVTLLDSCAFNFAIDNAVASWRTATASLTAALDASDIRLGRPGQQPIALRHLAVHLDRMNPARPSAARFTGELWLNGKPASMSGHLDLGLDGTKTMWSTASANIQLTHIPAGFLAQVSGSGDLPALLIGPQMDSVDLSLATTLSDPIGQARLTASAQSPNMDLAVKGGVENHSRIVIQPGVIAQMRLSSEALRKLSGGQSAVLIRAGAKGNQPAQLTVTLQRCDLGLAVGDLRPDFSDAHINLAIAMGDLRVADPSVKSVFDVHGFKWTVQTSDLTRQIDLGGGFDVVTASMKNAPSNRFVSRTTISNVINSAGRLQPDQVKIASHTNGSVPLGLVDALVGQGSHLAQTLGGSAQLDLDADYQPDKPASAHFVLKAERDLDIDLKATQPDIDKPILWNLAAQAKPVLVDCNAHGQFDLKHAVLTLDRYESRSLVVSSRLNGVLAVLPQSTAQQLKEHAVAVAATLKIKEGRFPLTDWRNSSVELLLTADSMMAYMHGQRVPIGRAFVRLSVHDRTASLDQFSAGVLKGNIVVTGATSLADNRYQSAYEATFQDLDAHSAVAVLYPSDTVEGRTQGTINGTVRIHGPLGNILKQAGGGGEVHVRNGVLAPLPVISDVMRFLNLGAALKQVGINLADKHAPETGNDTADIHFDFIGDRVRLNDIDVRTSVAQLFGKGTIGFDQSLDLDLVTKVLITLLGKKLKVTGTVNSPTINAF